MKKHFTLCLLFSVFAVTANAQTVTIPDDNFKNYLLNHPEINTNANSEIEVSEAAAFSDSIFCVSMGIMHLTGIEAFTNLKFLSCVNNNITSLNLSQNTALEGLICAMNSLTSLDISGNPNLKNLRCAINPINSLDLSGAPVLEYLYADQMQLTTLDLSNNPNLIELSCYDNNLNSIDLSANSALKRIDCSSNSLDDLDLSACTSLEYLMSNGNPGLGSLDLSANTQLIELRCVSNSLAQLDLSNCPELVKLDCPYNGLTTLDLSHNPNLQTIYCFSNQLTSINVANGNNAGIDLLWTSNNQISCFEVDDPAYSIANWTGNNFEFDAPAEFSIDCYLGLEEQQLDLAIYPNPASDQIQIDYMANGNDLVFILTDLQANQIAALVPAEGVSTVFDVSSLASGVYFVRAYSGNSVVAVQKVVKL